MHPHLVEELAAERRRELLAASAWPSRSRPGGHRPARKSARQRAGWMLVELGLRLASRPGSA
jgi:hypothetical protein